MAGSLGACASPPASADGNPELLRLGYLPTLTHAPAIVGVEEGLFAEHLGDVALRATPFSDGGRVIEALFSGALDVAYIGPGPAINGFAQSQGQALRIVSGAASGGVSLVVRPGIDQPEDLRGARLSSPALGNTQDIALRAWLQDQGLATDLHGGGDVAVMPQGNPQILETFRRGEIDGAWVAEPWATRLVTESGGTVLVDEGDLWPGGRFVTAQVVVRTEFLERHPEIVHRFLRAHVAAVDRIDDDPVSARGTVVKAIRDLTGAALAPATVAKAWNRLEFTLDPLPGSLRRAAEDAVRVGLLDPVDLDGIYELELLDAILGTLDRQRGSG